jgi:hypothetical protein
MANIFDYLKWKGDLDFKSSPFNPVDNIILSQLSYLTMDNIVPKLKDKDGISIDLAVRIFNEKSKEPNFVFTSQFKEDPDLIRALSASKRFRNCQLFAYENNINTELEQQFSALCIFTGDDHCFVAFRGTDVSIVGWKEDFNMGFLDVIPSQLKAVEYLEKMAPYIPGSIRVGGHSKGGNLAVYASSMCDKKIQNRIKAVYSNDAPGFNEKFITSSGFTAIKDRIHSYVPQASIIGMLLEHGFDSRVIKSSENGFMQHCLYSWEVMGSDLVNAEVTTAGSRFINNTLREWLTAQNNDQRELFIDTLYHVLNAADIKSINEFEKNKFSIAGKVLKSFSNIDETTKKMITKSFFRLLGFAKQNLDILSH